MKFLDGGIVVGVDGEGVAREALREALVLGQRLGRHVHAVHVYKPLPWPAGEEAKTYDARTRDFQGRRLRAWIDELGTDEQAPTIAVLPGEAVPVLLREAETFGATLMVLGAHGAGNAPSLLGSTAQRLVRHAPCSVLVRRGPRMAEAPVLVAVDDSPEAIHAAQQASLLAKALGQPLVLVHARNQSSSSELQQTFREAGVHAELVEVEGEPTQVVPAVAAARRVDLVVLGTHGRKGLSRLAYGSIAESILEATNASVMALKLEDPDLPIG